MTYFINIGVQKVSVTTCYYYNIWRRKNKSIQAILDMNYCLGSPWNALGLRVCSMDIGMGKTIVWGVYSVWYAASFLTRWKLRECTDLNMGYLAPTASNICPTEHKYCSTFKFQIGWPWEARTPNCTLYEKSFSKGNRLSMSWRSGVIIIYSQ